MNDSEISLAVAKVMYPAFKWQSWGGVAISDHDGMEFLYTDKDCAWDMVVWLACCDDLCTSDIDVILYSGDPHKEIAMAILEVSCAD